MRSVGLESPEQLGRGERHGGILKTNMQKVIKEHNVVGKFLMKLVSSESTSEKNEFLNRGGFSPSQWVLGRKPRGLGHMLDDDEIGHLGVLESQHEGGETEFTLRSKFRLSARKAYVKQDCSSRAARA